MTDQLVTVTFLPTGTKGEVPVGTGLMEAAHRAGVQVNALCGGKGSCGKCLGLVVNGALSESSVVEVERIGQQQLAQGVILLCQRKVLGNTSVQILMPDKSGGKHVPKKGNVLVREMEIFPSVQKRYHEMDEPTIHNQTADLDRILADIPVPVTVELGTVTEAPQGDEICRI